MREKWIYDCLLGLLALSAFLASVYCCDGQVDTDVCVRLFTTPKNFSAAGDFCKSLDGELADEDRRTVFQDMAAHRSDERATSYWVRSDERLAQCPYVEMKEEMKPELIYTDNCKEEKYFFCEIHTGASTIYCSKGSYRYKDKCFRQLAMRATYNGAVTLCTLQYGRLAVLDDLKKQRFVSSMNLTNSPYWAAKSSEDSFKWANGETFNMHCDFCNDSASSELGCIVFGLKPFTWSAMNCSTKNSVLCESQGLVRTTPAPSTTQVVLSCPVGYHWKYHEVSGYCYWETTYETERRNWYEAREFCQKYGGDLASYDNSPQEVVGIGGAAGHTKGLWIGLKRLENNGTSAFRWSDGSEYSYNNWDEREPKLSSRSKFCAMHGPNQSKWRLDYCGVRRWFVCSAPQVARPIAPETALEKRLKCNFTSSPYEWTLYRGHCYMIFRTAKFSWLTARAYCEDNGGYLASVHSFQETDFLISLGQGKEDTYYWIGSSALGLHSSLSWVDGTPLEFVYWTESSTTDSPETEYCVSFHDRDGAWLKSDCNGLQGLICKRGLNASYEFTSPPPTPFLPGYCPNGTYTFGNNCYKITGRAFDERKSWHAAKVQCTDEGARLASVHSKEEQEFVTDLILELRDTTWIGLKGNTKGTLYKWEDRSLMDYTNWNDGEPSTDGDYTSKTCVSLKHSSSSMGKWASEKCTSSNSFICQMRKDPTLNGPYQDPFRCPDMTDWWRIGSSCFGAYEEEDERAPWLEAQSRCRHRNAHLMSIRNFGITLFLKRRLKVKEAVYWTGVRETLKGKYEAVSGAPLVYTNWLHNQPASVSQLHNCVAIDAAGKWMVRDCKEQHPFVCEKNYGPQINVTKPEYSKCTQKSALWKDFGGNQCYLIGSSMVLWKDALSHCYRQGGSLASFHSENEVSQVVKHLDVTNRYHIGLGRLADGSFGWADRSPVDFTSWDVNQPNPDARFRECAFLNPVTGKWKTNICIYEMGYICSFPKVALTITEVAHAVNTSAHTETTKPRLEVGGILGILICVAVILAIVGVASYYLCPSTRMRSRLREPESP